MREYYSVIAGVEAIKRDVLVVRQAAGEKRLFKEHPPMFRTSVTLVIPNIVSSSLSLHLCSVIHDNDISDAKGRADRMPPRLATARAENLKLGK